MNSPVTLQRENGVVVVTIDSPPVNTISSEVSTALRQGVEQIEAMKDLATVVICCAGRTFVAGGDIRGFEDPTFSPRFFNETLARLENLSVPVIAVLHGTTLGGGLELALACHYRVALPGTKLGFPEINIGIIPGSLGTQRLPRLIPADEAFDMMLSGRPITAEDALHKGLLDEIGSYESPFQAGMSIAQKLARGDAHPIKTRVRAVRRDGLSDDFIAKKSREVESKYRALPAARELVGVFEVTLRGDFVAGQQAEEQAFIRCVRSSESRALRHVFFAEREAAKIPGFPAKLMLRSIQKVGVVGAGTMGGGIAMNFANIGIQVKVLEASLEALDRGIGIIRGNYEASAAKGRISSDAVVRRMDSIQGTLSYEDLSDCDLVIEAVFEDMQLKQNVVKRLGDICKKSAIIATNTSTLDVDVIAQASGRPSDVIGTHFFSPANVMRLLEVIKGAETAPEALLTVMDIARQIGKISVVSGVCYGFIGNRMAEQYMRENEFLLLEGATPAEIDGAIENLDRVGMAMGPCRMLDMAGIDVGAKTLIELEKSGGLPPDPSYRVVCRRLFADGRFGQKTGSGYYRYEGRSPVAEPATLAACEALAQEHGIQRRSDITPEEIVERLMLPLINEAAKILEEGIALRSGDIDVVWTAGYGFPRHRGGPLWLADEWGLPYVVGRLEHYRLTKGNQYGYWTPAKLLKDLAASGKRFADLVEN